MIFQLVYCSIPTHGVSFEDANAIWSAAKKFNAEAGISGILFFSPEAFIQCLEGDRETVNALYHKVARDRRHQKPQLLFCNEVSERTFGSWTMGFVSSSAANVQLMVNQIGLGKFRPETLSSDGAMAFLVEAGKTIRSV